MPEIARGPEEFASPQSPESESFGSGLHKNLTDKAAKYASWKRTSSALGQALKAQLGTIPEIREAAEKVCRCSSWLCFMQFVESKRVQLRSADFCDKFMLCPACAHQRAIDLWQKYGAAVFGSHQAKGNRHYMLTLTWPNVKPSGWGEAAAAAAPTKAYIDSFSDALNASLSRASNAVRSFWERKKKKGTGPFRNVVGLIVSTEVTVRASGLHPHFHCLYTVGRRSDGIDVNELRSEWLEKTGGNQVWIDRLNTQIDLLEAFKYALTFPDLGEGGQIDPQQARDRGMIYYALRGQRLVRSYGTYFGIGDLKTLTGERDPVLDEEWIDWWFRWNADRRAYRIQSVGRDGIKDVA